MKSTAVVPLLLLLAAGCTPFWSAASAAEPSQSWQSFTGRAVPTGTATYVAGLDAAGTDRWLTEGWFTTGHSHTGLFKNTDNAQNWSQVLGWDGWPLWQKHFGAETAIVAAEFEEPGYQLHARLLSTSNGGRRWYARNLPARDNSSIRSIYFVDPSDGWLMLSLGSSGGYRCGQVKESIAIFKTTDGGATWSETVRVDAQHPDAGGISLDGAKVGLSFASATRGFLTTSRLGQGNIAYWTGDGGSSWYRVSLPFDESPGIAYTSAPTWLSSSAGLISVNISPRPEMACVIQRSPAASAPAPTPGPWDVEAPFGLVSPYPGSLLLHTVDAGATWSTVQESSSWGDISSFAALDAAHWAVANGDELWQTVDAGRTWRTNEHALDPRCSFGLVRFIDQETGLASEGCQQTLGVIEGCQKGAGYTSDWDCPPIGNQLLISRDGGATWSPMSNPPLK